MNTELNKQVSVWRGNNTPPTDYHLWIKENGDILIKILDNWSTVANVTNLGDISTLKEDLSTTKTDLGELKLNVEGLKIQEVEAETSNTLKSYSLIYNGESKGIINIPKDRFLKNVLYDLTTKKLIFTFIISDGTETTLEISVADLVDVYKAGNNVTIKDNTISVDFSPITEVLDTTIKRIWRLEGGEKKEIELNGDEIDLGGLTLDQWLIKRGNYAAVMVTPLLYAPPGSITLIDLGGGTYINYNVVLLGSSYVGQLSVYDKGKEVGSSNAPYGASSYMNIYLYPACIISNDYKDTRYCIECDGIGTYKVSDINKVAYCFDDSNRNGTFLIPFSSKNNYGIEFADGHYERLNKTDDVVIGAEANPKNEIFYKTSFDHYTFRKYGSLNVNGSLTARDTRVKGLEVNGTLHVNGQIDAIQSIHTNNALEAGETTINGTLHVEDHDIKTQSLYPAKTGSSTLKDASKGKVKGNYKVSAGNLGKGAHNYDKLFVKNIMWSDQTDITSADTSLNGEGTIQVWSKEGFDKSPTLWLNGTDTENITGIYRKDKNIVIEQHDKFGYVNYSVGFSFDGRLTDFKTPKKEFLWGNGQIYGVDSIPSNFIKPYTTLKLKRYDGNGYDSTTLQNRERGLSIIRESKNNTWGGSYVINISPEYSTISNYNEDEDTDLISIISQGGKSNQLYAADGSVFDINTKADLSSLNNYLPLTGGTISNSLNVTGTLTAGGKTVLTSHQPIYKLTLLKNGSNVGIFTPTASDSTLNISVPTKLSELTDDVVNGKYLSLSGGTITNNLIVNGKITQGGNSVLDISTTNITDLTIKINNVSRTIPTKLSELTNDIVEACTTDEINALFE